MYGCESWTIKKAEHWRINAFELWCWRRLESPLDFKEIQPVNPKGNQSWIFIGSWNSNTLATWCEELTHLKRPCCWDRLRTGGEGDNREWDGWMASPTWWTWVWASSGSWWWTGNLMCYSPWGWTQLSYWTELMKVPGFSCCSAWAYSALWHVKSSQARDWIWIPWTSRQILNHQATREFWSLKKLFFILNFLFCIGV